jgi:hypothetical protein
MPSFSERMGIKPMKDIILRDSISEEIRNGLWSLFEIYFWRSLEDPTDLYPLWMYYFKKPIDTIPNYDHDKYGFIRDYFFSCEWNQVYDFIEFIANNFSHTQKSQEKTFMILCNFFLERELSAYRFIDGIIAPLTSEEEIVEVDEALEKSKSIGLVSDHLRRSIELLADRKNPDYRNSIKESISAVEAICKLIVGNDKSTLGEALKIIDDKITIHPALKKALSNIYGYTCDAEGIRHSLLNEPTLDLEDAKFMLVSCSAFTNYLIAKSSKAGIELRKEK